MSYTHGYNRCYECLTVHSQLIKRIDSGTAFKLVPRSQINVIPVLQGKLRGQFVDIKEPLKEFLTITMKRSILGTWINGLPRSMYIHLNSQYANAQDFILFYHRDLLSTDTHTPAEDNLRHRAYAIIPLRH